jgi:hypothetical protein
MNRFKIFTVFSVILVSTCYCTDHLPDDSDTDTYSNTDAHSSYADTNIVSNAGDSHPEIYDRNTDFCECGDHIGVECVDFSGQAGARRSCDFEIPGVKVTALCNSNGDPLTNVDSVFLDENGMFTLRNVPKGRIGILFQCDESEASCNSDDDDLVNTWYWGVNTDANNQRFPLIPNVMYDMIRMYMDYPSDICEGEGWFMLHGAAYWSDPASDTKRPVGCGVITIAPETSQTDLWYLEDNKLPSKNFISTNPMNGEYVYCGRTSAEEYTVTLSVDGEMLVQDSFPMRTIEGEKNSHMVYLNTKAELNPDCR